MFPRSRRGAARTVGDTKPETAEGVRVRPGVGAAAVVSGFGLKTEGEGAEFPAVPLPLLSSRGDITVCAALGAPEAARSAMPGFVCGAPAAAEPE